jgi:CHASE2 domain-containing sensor protein
MLHRIKAALGRPLARLWRRPQFRQHLILNLCIGIGIAVVLRAPFVQNMKLVNDARNSLLTWQLNAFTGHESGDDLAWIDIDEAAYNDWNSDSKTDAACEGGHSSGKACKSDPNPDMVCTGDHKAFDITNRCQLLRLIGYAIEGKPRVVLVDIDFAQKNQVDLSSDRKLENFIYTYRKTCTAPCTKIVLARTFSSVPSDAAKPQVTRKANASILDAFFTHSHASSPVPLWRSADPVLLGSVDFQLEPDRSVRRWRLWEDSCGGFASGERIPSAVLVAASLERGLAASGVDEELSGLDGPPCSPTPSHHTNEYGDLPFTAAVTDEPLRRRIIYRIPLPGADADRQAGPVVVKASTITTNPLGMPSPPPFFENRIVVIGSSFEEGGDADHPTPVGPMPGSFVLVNELNALLRHEDLKEAPLPVVLVVESVLILIISVLFAEYKPALAGRLALSTVVLASLTVGLFAFALGFWFDSVIPLIGVLIHEQVELVYKRVAHALRSVWAGITSRFSQKTR